MQFHFYVKINDNKEFHAGTKNAFKADTFYKEINTTLKKGYYESKKFDAYVITFCYDELANHVHDMSVCRYRKV